MNLGGLQIRNTSTLIDRNTHLCMLVYAPPKRGKTTLASTLNKLTKKYFNKPTLFIAVEAGDGGGTMSITDASVDFVTPRSYTEVSAVLAALENDTTYGGIVLDSATEYVNRFLKPYALKFPYTRGTASPTRAMGVPDMGDYQTMGEQARIDFNRLINLTSHPDLRIRKHLIVTALEKEKTDRKTQELLRIQPDLPGAMAEASSAMFQTVGFIELKTTIEKENPNDPKSPTKRVTRRLLSTETNEDNKRIAGDRTGLIPSGSPLDLEQVYEKFWIPRFEQQTNA